MVNKTHDICTLSFTCDKPEDKTCSRACVGRLDSDKPDICPRLSMKSQWGV